MARISLDEREVWTSIIHGWGAVLLRPIPREIYWEIAGSGPDGKEYLQPVCNGNGSSYTPRAAWTYRHPSTLRLQQSDGKVSLPHGAERAYSASAHRRSRVQDQTRVPCVPGDRHHPISRPAARSKTRKPWPRTKARGRPSFTTAPVTRSRSMRSSGSGSKSKFRMNRYGRSMGCIEMGRFSCRYCFMHAYPVDTQRY